MQLPQSGSSENEYFFYSINLNLINDRRRSPYQLAIHNIQTIVRRLYLEIYRNIKVNPINTIFNGCFFVVLGYFLFKLLLNHYKIIANPFQNELREGAILLTTKALLSGINPYDLDNQPQYTNVYGIFYHLVVYPFVKLFGLNFQIHRLVSATFIIATCIGLFKLLSQIFKISWLLCFSASIILYSQLIYLVNPLARPDGLGLFIFLIGLYIPWRYQFSRLSLIFSIGLGLLGLLTKPYFFFVIPYVFLYLFIFKSKLKGIRYGILSLFSLIATVTIVNMFFETYFNNTFFAHLNAPIGNDYLNDPYFSIIQFRRYIKHNLGISIICLLIPAIWIISKIFAFFKINKLVDFISKGKIYSKFFDIRKKFTNIGINLFSLNDPLIKASKTKEFKDDDIDKIPVDNSINFVIFCLVISLFIFFARMGHHHGNWLIYIHQLISPFLLIVVFKAIDNQWRSPISLSQILPIESNAVKNFIQDISQLLYHSVFAGLIILNLLTLTADDFMYKFEYGTEKWLSLNNLVAKHQNIFNSPAITSVLIEQNKPVYDSGLSEYFSDGVKSRKVFGIPFSMDQKNKEHFQKFNENIKEKVRDHQFDLIVLTPHYSPFISEDFLKQYYRLTQNMSAPMLFTLQDYDLEIWEPKS